MAHPFPTSISLCQAQGTGTFFPSFFQSWCSCPAQARSLGSNIFCRNWGLEDHRPTGLRGAALSKGPSPVARPGLYLSLQSPGVHGCSSCPTARKCSWTNACSSCRGMLRLWAWASLRKRLSTWSGGQAAGGVSGTPGSLP